MHISVKIAGNGIVIGSFQGNYDDDLSSPTGLRDGRVGLSHLSSLLELPELPFILAA
ncbi:MAG: hypothetical protein ABJ118_01655 [Luteolibacter sp.]